MTAPLRLLVDQPIFLRSTLVTSGHCSSSNSSISSHQCSTTFFAASSAASVRLDKESVRSSCRQMRDPVHVTWSFTLQFRMVTNIFRSQSRIQTCGFWYDSI